MGVASRAATPITVASPLQRHGSRGDVARKSGPTSRTVTRRGASLLAWGAAFFLSTKEEKKASVGCETCACTRPSARWTASGVPGVGRAREDEKGKGKREGKREIVYSRWGIEVACAERPVWFAAKLPATAQAPNTLFTFDQHRGEEARCSNEENKGVVVGNVSAACRTISAPRFRRNRENSRIGGSWGAFERDSWRSAGASSSLNGRVSSKRKRLVR